MAIERERKSSWAFFSLSLFSPVIDSSVYSHLKKCVRDVRRWSESESENESEIVRNVTEHANNRNKRIQVFEAKQTKCKHRNHQNCAYRISFSLVDPTNKWRECKERTRREEEEGKNWAKTKTENTYMDRASRMDGTVGWLVGRLTGMDRWLREREKVNERTNKRDMYAFNRKLLWGY